MAGQRTAGGGVINVEGRANILNILCTNITCESDRCALIAPQIASDCAHMAYTPLVLLELLLLVLLLHCNSVKFNFPIKCQKFVAVVAVVVCLACCCVKFFASN